MDARYDLAGRKAIVTGGAGGLGRGIAARRVSDAESLNSLSRTAPCGMSLHVFSNQELYP